jgi:hypothetical protein
MAGTFTPLEGEDVEDIIEENGGVGEWEVSEGSEAGAVPRWLFPRFPGAEDNADMYLSRSGIGPYDTDVETMVGWLSAPRNIVGCVLVVGDPGCGKTALIEAAVTHMIPQDEEGTYLQQSRLLTVLCTPDHTKDSLFLKFVGEGHGDCVNHDHVDTPDGTWVECVGGCNRSPFTLGPIPYAAKYGKILYGDEAMMLVDGVKPVLYSLADGRRFLPEGNVDGSPLEIHPDFRLVLSSNPLVRGASLPEPLASRAASTTITVETSAAMLRDLDIDESIVAAWEALGTAGLWRPQIREMRMADYWLSTDEMQAVSAFLPEHCPESQREQIKNIVVGFLGGSVRRDGRLVVS